MRHYIKMGVNIHMLEEASFIITAVLTILLIISELLAWSNCKPNSISQYLYSKLACPPMEDSATIATQTPQSL